MSATQLRSNRAGSIRKLRLLPRSQPTRKPLNKKLPLTVRTRQKADVFEGLLGGQQLERLSEPSQEMPERAPPPALPSAR